MVEEVYGFSPDFVFSNLDYKSLCGMRIRIIFKWYDFWIGFFWDRKKRTLYIFPIPMLGIKIGPRDKHHYHDAMMDFMARDLLSDPGKWGNVPKMKDPPPPMFPNGYPYGEPPYMKAMEGMLKNIRVHPAMPDDKVIVMNQANWDSIFNSPWYDKYIMGMDTAKEGSKSETVNTTTCTCCKQFMPYKEGQPRVCDDCRDNMNFNKTE